MRTKFAILLLTALAGSNVSASRDILHLLNSCSAKLIATAKNQFTLKGEPMILPARERATDLVSWTSNVRHPLMRAIENKDVLYVADFEQMIAPNLDPSIGKFLRSLDHVRMLQFPNAQDRLHVEALIYATTVGRPTRTIYGTTDFHFEVLEKEVVVEMKNLNSVKGRVRLNQAFWIVSQHADEFPYVTFAGSVFHFPVKHFDEFINTVQALGFSFY